MNVSDGATQNANQQYSFGYTVTTEENKQNINVNFPMFPPMELGPDPSQLSNDEEEESDDSFDQPPNAGASFNVDVLPVSITMQVPQQTIPHQEVLNGICGQFQASDFSLVSKVQTSDHEMKNKVVTLEGEFIFDQSTGQVTIKDLTGKLVNQKFTIKFAFPSLTGNVNVTENLQDITQKIPEKKNVEDIVSLSFDSKVPTPPNSNSGNQGMQITMNIPSNNVPQPMFNTIPQPPTIQAKVSVTPPQQTYGQPAPYAPPTTQNNSPYAPQSSQNNAPYPQQSVINKSSYPQQPTPNNAPYPQQPTPQNAPYPQQPTPNNAPYPQQPIPNNAPYPQQPNPQNAPYPQQPTPNNAPYPQQPIPNNTPYPQQPTPQNPKPNTTYPQYTQPYNSQGTTQNMFAPPQPNMPPNQSQMFNQQNYVKPQGQQPYNPNTTTPPQPMYQAPNGKPAPQNQYPATPSPPNTQFNPQFPQQGGYPQQGYPNQGYPQQGYNGQPYPQNFPPQMGQQPYGPNMNQQQYYQQQQGFNQTPNRNQPQQPHNGYPGKY